MTTAPTPGTTHYRHRRSSAAQPGLLHVDPWLATSQVHCQLRRSRHHIAWRTPDDAQQLQWRNDLARRGYNVTPVIDRTYFHSIYYREPGEVLFEIATDPPGFAIEEPTDHLGERLILPHQYEAQRAALERVLPRLTLPRTDSKKVAR
jgi:hypothetical protein